MILTKIQVVPSNAKLIKSWIGGMTGPILLVPELCFMTGLTDQQRSDLRMESLVQRSNRLTRVPSVVQELLSWNMKFSPKLLEMKGRQLQPETVILKTKVNYSANNADWTREVQRGLFNPANITKW